MTRRTTLAGLRVLVVEDETMVSLLIEDVLAAEECVIVGPYHRVDAALSAISEQIVDVAVLDVNVRGVLIFPVAENLARRGIPFLFVSGYGDSVMPADHPEWRVCTKPFVDTDFVAMLLEQIQASQSQ